MERCLRPGPLVLTGVPAFLLLGPALAAAQEPIPAEAPFDATSGTVGEVVYDVQRTGTLYFLPPEGADDIHMARDGDLVSFTFTAYSRGATSLFVDVYSNDAANSVLPNAGATLLGTFGPFSQPPFTVFERTFDLPSPIAVPQDIWFSVRSDGGGLATGAGLIIDGDATPLLGTSSSLLWWQDDYFDFQSAGLITVRLKEVTPVAIDIKPGSSQNTVNLGSQGVTQVAILSSDTFDATQVDPLTVLLADAGVKVRGNGNPQVTMQDVDGDGYLDLVLHMLTEGFSLTDGDVAATLTGSTFGGDDIEGTDAVRVVP